MAESIVLRAGCARWLRRAHDAVGLAAALAILTAGAAMAWTVAALVALLAVHAGISWRMNHERYRGRLHLAVDGSAVFFSARGVRGARLRAGAWVSRCLCVLPLTDLESGRRFHCTLCRSLNAAESYRRLLVQLRMHGAMEPGRGPEWS